MGKPSKRGTGKPHPRCRPRGKQVGCRTMMTSLLSTVRRNHGPRTVKTTTSQGPCGQSAIIKDMVLTDAPNIKRLCHSWPRARPSCFFGRHQEPREGLYLHEAQELAEVMTKTTTWMGTARAHQMVFPIMIAEGRRVISMSRAVNETPRSSVPDGGPYELSKEMLMSRAAGQMKNESGCLLPVSQRKRSM